MTKQELDRPDVCSVFEQMDSKCVPQTMGRDRLGNAANAMRLPTGILDGAPRDGFAQNISWEQPMLWLFGPPPDAQNVQQPRRQHDVTIFLPLSLLDADDHSLTINVARLQLDRLRDSQSRRVAGCQDRAV